MFEPDQSLHGSLRFAKSIDHSCTPFIRSFAINTSNQDVVIPANSAIGTVKAIQAVQPKPTQNSQPLDIMIISTLKFGKNLTNQQLEIIIQHRNAFSWSDTDMARTSHKNTPSTSTQQYCHTAYHLPYALKSTNKSAACLKQTSLVQATAHGPYQSFLSNKNGAYRFCVDFRRLNGVTNKDAYPIPRIDDTMNALSDARWFISLDLASGYHQIAMNENDRHKTAFCVQNGLYEFNVKPYGVTNGPADLQRFTDTLLADFNWVQCLVYFDDVLIFAKTFNDLCIRFVQILAKFIQANIKMQPSKCEFAANEVMYLGHLINEHGIRPDPNKTKAIDNFTSPKTVCQLKTFMGIESYYRKFIANHSHIAAPLFKLLEANQPFNWDDTCQRAFEVREKKF
jgi:hypothetical protein